MAAASYLKENPSPTEEEVREALEGNLCRCTGYQNIVASILDAAGAKVWGAIAWRPPRSTSDSPCCEGGSRAPHRTRPLHR